MPSGVILGHTGWVASTNAPSGASGTPAYALDSSWNTRFSTDEDQAAGLYFEVNLGSAETFGELAMYVPNSPHDYARGYEVYVSANGSTWDPVAACTGVGTSELVELPGPDGPVRQGGADHP